MKSMRAVAAEVRRDAVAGLSPEQLQAFVDALLAIKDNLANGENGVRNGRRAKGREL